MSIFDRILSRWGYFKTEQVTNPAMWLRRTAGTEKFRLPSGELYKNQAELYQRLSWVHSAVNVVSSSCATTRFAVKKLKGEEEEEIQNHPFELLLRKPNPLMSRFEFIQSTVGYHMLTGNAYWWLNRPNPNAPPIEMWVIPSNKIRPVPDERLYLRGYMYDPGDGQEIPLDLHEVAHFKRFHPLNPFVGLSPIEAIAVIAVSDMESQKWNAKLYGENNARLPGILAFKDPIVDSEWDRLMAEVDENAKKRNIMMMRGVGEGGIDWIQATLSKQDMEFLAGRKFTKEEIYGIYAPGLASMLDVNATEANAKTGRATFSEYGLWPLMVSIAEKVTNDVLPAYGPDLIGEFDDIRYTDRALELQEIETAAKVMTIDELRNKFYQLDELDDDRGEMLVAQIGAAPVSVGDSEGEESPIPAPDIFKPREPEASSEEEGEEVAEDQAAKGEMGKWRRFCLGRVKSGKGMRPFESQHIPLELKAEVMGMLAEAKTVGDVNAIFDAAEGEHFADYGDFAELVGALNEATRALREKGESDGDE